MFRLTNASQGLKRSKFAMAMAPIALVASAAPLMGAGPWDWRFEWNSGRDRYGHDHGRERDRGREVVVRPEPRPAYERPHIDVMPSDLSVSAYEARGTVIVLVSGMNPTSNYTTSLEAIDTSSSMPKLQMHNYAGRGYCAQVMTPVSINAAFRADRCPSMISIRIGDRDICVPVTQVQSL